MVGVGDEDPERLFGFLAEGVGLATAFNWIGIAFVGMSAVSLVIGRRFAR